MGQCTLGLGMGVLGRFGVVVLAWAAAFAQGPPAWRAHVDELKAKGDAAGALAVLQKAPSSASTEDEIGFLLAVLGRRSEAIPHFKKSLTIDGNDAPAAFIWGLLCGLFHPGKRRAIS